MRISDWSSDVCSADLLPKGEALLGRSAVDGAFDIEDRVDTADCFHRQWRDDGLFAALLELRGDIGQLEEITARVTPAQRSEEHTSALQSLMRNSYAVLCLKKKTNKPVPQSASDTLLTITT